MPKVLSLSALKEGSENLINGSVQLRFNSGAKNKKFFAFALLVLIIVLHVTSLFSLFSVVAGPRRGIAYVTYREY